jgi:hypothetical protein
MGKFPIHRIIVDAAGMSRAMSIGSLICLFWAVILLLKPGLLNATGNRDAI